MEVAEKRGKEAKVRFLVLVEKKNRRWKENVRKEKKKEKDIFCHFLIFFSPFFFQAGLQGNSFIRGTTAPRKISTKDLSHRGEKRMEPRERKGDS